MSDEKMLSQTEVNDLLGRTRQEARDRAKREFEAELKTQQEKAEQVQLAENKEYKTLAEKLQAQVNEQVGLTEKIGRYDEIMKAVLENALTGLSDEIKKAVESIPGDIEAKLEWLTANKELFKKEPGDGVGTPTSAPRTKEETKPKFRLKGI